MHRFSKLHKVIAVKKLRANQLGPTEKEETTTAVVFVNAAGMNTRPIVIHKGLRVQEDWKEWHAKKLHDWGF